MPLVPLLQLPHELLMLIALHLATRPPNLGPPAALVPLLCACRFLHDTLAPKHNPTLYARIARAKFVLGHEMVPARKSLVQQHASVLPSLCLALRVIRSGDPYHPDASTALQLAYTLLRADDVKKPALTALSYALPPAANTHDDDDDAFGRAKNKRQLGWAGARAFALRWIRARLWEGRYGERDPNPDGSQAWRVGWPRDANASAAALWVLWFFESKEILSAERDIVRQNIMALVLPFVVAPFRYASALAPPHHYTIPLLPGVRARLAAGTDAMTVPTFHGEYPIYALDKPRRKRRSSSSSSSSNVKTRILGNNTPKLLCAPPARLLFFARFQAASRMGIPPHLPLDRADFERRWVAAGNQGPTPVGPTQADLVEKNTRPIVRFERQVVPIASTSLEHVWAVDPADAIHEDEERERQRERDRDERWGPYSWRVRICRGYEEEQAGSENRGPAPGRIGRVYQLGSFAGMWAGTMIMPAEQPYSALVNTPGGAYPPGGLTREDFVAAARPVYMRIREHWSFFPETPAPPAPANSTTGDEGMANGWFPAGTTARDAGEGKLEVRVPQEDQGKPHSYETLLDGRVVREGVHNVDRCPGCVRERAEARRRRRARDDHDHDESGESTSSTAHADNNRSSSSSASPSGSGSGSHKSSHSLNSSSPWPEDTEGWEPLCDGVQDVVFTGETDPHHGQAWHHYDFSGRVRPWDGLIGLVMRPRNRTIGLSTFFISGHLVGADMFEGTWQMAAHDVLAPSWGGSFCLARGEE
ncbi:hypothetical protein C8F01DRAFT_1369454 [Mycena amicta]|nr:hypothetical protein C8F01DRAFT_1369435 [Mycena amicta]KAJ7061239.1 hypothetical protein C8F01DRAFT_1369454 [Mycena amicta]